MSRYKHFNLNPVNNISPDCTIRAIGLLTDTTWTETYDGVCAEGRRMYTIVEGRNSVDNYLVGTNVTAVLADFTNMKFCIKERDANNILKPLREFDLNEKVQQTIPANPVNNNQIQNESGIQKQIDDLRSMMTDFINSQKNTSNNNSNKSKGGNN